MKIAINFNIKYTVIVSLDRRNDLRGYWQYFPETSRTTEAKTENLGDKNRARWRGGQKCGGRDRLAEKVFYAGDARSLYEVIGPF